MSPAFLASVAATPAVEVDMNATPPSIPDVALRTLAPVTGPSVHEPTAAMPEAFVVTTAPETEPPPLATAKVTIAPSIGDPFWSLTMTDGGGVTTVPAAPVMDVEEFAVRVVATEGITGGAVVSPLQLMQAISRDARPSRAATIKVSFRSNRFSAHLQEAEVRTIPEYFPLVGSRLSQRQQDSIAEGRPGALSVHIVITNTRLHAAAGVDRNRRSLISTKIRYQLCLMVDEGAGTRRLDPELCLSPPG